MSEKIPAGETCIVSKTGQHLFIDWRDVHHSGPDSCAHCGLFDPNDPRFPLAKKEAPKVEAVSTPSEDPYSWKLEVQIPTSTLTSDVPAGAVHHQEVEFDIPEENFRHVTAPIAADKLREYFTNKDLFYVVNYTNSKLKAGSFLTYLTNLDIPCDVVFDGDIGYDEYAEIMLAYFKQTSIVKTAGLHLMAAELMLMCKGLPYHQSPYSLPIDPNIPFRFISENLDIVNRWVDFLDSSQVFALASIKALNDHFKPKEKFEVIDDKEFVSPNISQMYVLPHFIAMYFSVPNAMYKLNYYKPQFEEFMFKNDRLAKHFGNKNNLAALMLTAFAQGVFEAKDIEGNLFKIGVFDPKHQAYTPEPYVYVPPVPAQD